MNDHTLIINLYQNYSFLSHPTLKNLMDDAFKKPEGKITIPDDMLDLKTETRGIVATVWHRIFILLQCLWLRFKLMSKSYRVRFEKAIQTILGAYQERTKEIYLLAIRSINHQGRIVYLKNNIKKAEGELLKKNQELQTFKTSRDRQVKLRDYEIQRYKKVIDTAQEIKKIDEELSGISYLFHLLWPSSDRHKKIEQLTKKIQELDNQFFPDNNPKQELSKGIDYLIEMYDQTSSYTGPVAISNHLNHHIDASNKNIKNAEEAIVQLEEKITALKAEIPATENANKETLEQLQKVTKNPDYYPVLDEEEAEMLGENEANALEETQVNTTNTPPKPQRSPTYLQMIKDLKSHTVCRDLAILWVILLNNDKQLDQHIKSWKCDPSGNFSLELTQPIKLWIDTPDRRGGCVFLFGDNGNRSIEGTLKRAHIQTRTGFESYCVEKLLLNKRITPQMNGIHFQNSNLVKVSGTYLGKTGEKIYSFRSLRGEWKDRVSFIPHDHPGGHSAYFEEKYSNA